MAQILPGIDEYLSRGIKDIGDSLSLLFETDRKTQRGIRNMFLEKPELVQEFVDLEKRAPGTLKKLGFGNISKSLEGMEESTKQTIEKATRGEKVKGEVAKVTAERQKAQLDVDAYSLLPKLFADDPTLREDFARGKIDLPSLLEQAKAKREAELGEAEQPGKLKAAKVTGEELTDDVDAMAKALVYPELGVKYDPEKVAKIMLDPAKKATFGEAVETYRNQKKAEEQEKLEALKGNVKGKPDRLELKDILKGSAREIFREDPVQTTEEIRNRVLEKHPELADVPGISEIAFEATNDVITPGTEAERRARVVAPGAFEGFKTIDDLETKAKARGEEFRGLGVLDRLVQTDARATSLAGGALGGALTGARAGSLVGGIPGAVVGGVGGLLGAPIIRGVARSLQSEDSQSLWNAAQNIAAAVYRRESGAAVKDSEIRTTLERYIDLSTDKKSVREVKKRLREALRREIEASSGLPDNTAREKIETVLGARADTLLAEAREKDANDTVTQAVGKALTLGQDDPDKALKILRQDNFANVKAGGGEIPEYKEAVRTLNLVKKIDKQIAAINKFKQVDSAPTINALIAERDALTGALTDPNVNPKNKAVTPEQFLEAMRQEVIKINNELPSMKSDSARDATMNKKALLEDSIQKLEAQLRGGNNQ